MASKLLQFSFSAARVSYLFDTSFLQLDKWVSREKAVVITDENVFARHKKKFKGWNTIVLKPGEAYKIHVK